MQADNSDWALVEYDGDLLGLLPKKYGTVVGHHCSDWNKDGVAALAILGSGLCECPAYSDAYLLYQQVILAPFPCQMDACYCGGKCDKVSKPGTESALF